jgi:outer membrane biosynthesis protein TonB
MAEIFQTHDELGTHAEQRARTFLRWLGGSVVAHAVLLASLVYVPVLRDTFSLANELAGFRVVSKDYKKTEIYERATLINLAAQKLYYPAGFFDPASQTAVPSPDDPKFIATVNPTPVPTPRPPRIRVKPTPTPSPSPATAEETAKNADDKSKPTASPSPAEPQTPEEAERIAKEAGVEPFSSNINVKPFEDLLAEAKKKRDAGKIDLTGTLDISAEGDRQDDGSISNLEIKGNSATNEDVHALANAFIGALSDSKALAALKGTRHLRLEVRLDDKHLLVQVLTETATTDEAERLANGYSMLLLAGGLKKKGQDEEAIYKSLKLRNDAQRITLTLDMPRADAGALVSKLTAKSQTPPPTPGE